MKHKTRQESSGRTKDTRQTVSRPAVLKLRTDRSAACSLLCLLLVLPFLGGCGQTPTEPTGSMQPTVVTTTFSPGPEPTDAVTPTAQPTPLIRHDLVPLANYGRFASGHTLQLPAGLWLDTGDMSRISQVSDLVVTSEGQGRPTLSRPTESKALLTISDCDSVTFRQVRFGYDRPVWHNGVTAGTVPLIEITNSTNIRFEDCEFFGGSAMALLISGSENIVLENCTVYNQAGAPLATGDDWLPSQIRCSGCLFETIDSGILPLNVRDSSFDRCVWVGRKGYAVPIAAANRREAEQAILQNAGQTLPGQLTGILAARVAHFRDEALAITCRNNSFISDEVYVLFDQMEQSLPDLLPDGTISWALAGQKAEEAAPGQLLDPVLGLHLTVRTRIDSVMAPTAKPTAPADGQTAEPTETAGQNRIYDLDRLLQDLASLRQLQQKLDPLITGDVRIFMSDQNQQALLTASIPVDQLASWLDPAHPDRLLKLGGIRLLNPDLPPADFCQRDNAGYFTARHLIGLLREGLPISPSPLILYPDDTACFLEQRLSYLGTTLTEQAALHHFDVLVERTAARSLGSEPPWQLLTAATLVVQADTAAKQLSPPAGQPFQLPDAAQREQIDALLREPLALETPADGQIELYALSYWSNEAGAVSPVMILSADESGMVIRTILFDEQCSPRVVDLTLAVDDDQWQIINGSVLSP